MFSYLCFFLVYNFTLKLQKIQSHPDNESQLTEYNNTSCLSDYNRQNIQQNLLDSMKIMFTVTWIWLWYLQLLHYLIHQVKLNMVNVNNCSRSHNPSTVEISTGESPRHTWGKEQHVDCVTKLPECKTMAELDGVSVFRLWSAQQGAPSEVLSGD